MTEGTMDKYPETVTERNAELEQDKKDKIVEHFEAYGQCRDSRRIAVLEQENKELKCECRRCIYTDCPCILSDYGKDRNGICDHFKDVFDENIELKDELKNWKDEWQEQVQKATNEGFTRTLQTIQLSKATEIIKEFVEWATWQGSNCPSFKSIQDKAEQFLSEVNLKDMRIEELEKANEWHYVANDDLPKVDNKIVLCVCGNGYIDGKTNYILKLLTRKEFPLFQPVYAWKEIVLPELKESE